MSIRAILFLVLVIFASGCVSNPVLDLEDSSKNQTQLENKKLCDADFNAYTNIDTREESKNQRIYVFEDKARLTGDIGILDTPESMNKSEVLDKIEVELRKSRSTRENQLCHAKIFSNNQTLKCNFTPERGKYIARIYEKLEGCGYIGGGGSTKIFYEIVEGKNFHSDDLNLTVSDFEISEEDKGWENLRFKSELTNKNITAQEGITAEYTLLTSSGNTEDNYGPYNVLKGYTDSRTVGMRFRADAKPQYILFKLQEVERPYIAFKVTD